MSVRFWRDAPVARRVQLLRWGLPLAIIALVVLYQLGFATYVHDTLGHAAHTAVEIGFYSIVGPAVTWLTLGLIGGWLAEKEHVEQAARAQERRLASIVDASADAILSVDDEGMIRTWNRGAGQMFGYDAGDIIGRPLADLLAVSPASDHPDASLLASPALIQNHETVCLTREGRRISVEATRTPLQPAGASIILRDISRRKAREQLLEEERARIARDLHDGLAQNLYFVGLKLDYVRKSIDQQPQEAQAELVSLKQTVQQAIREVRRTIFALRPLNLADGDLAQAIRAYARDFGEQNGLDIEVAVTGDAGQTPAALQPVIIRVVQESLNNIAKHAQTEEARITLSCEGQVCRLEVQDEGRGFVPAARAGNGRHFGLRQMQERVENAGGRFSIDSAPGAGTRVQAELPRRGWS